MKKSMLAVLLAFAMAICGGCAAEKDAGRTIVTSFYPMYVFVQNVARDIPGVRVVNMASENVGCLHDYQLQTRDMVTLEGADVLVINGGGMEQFMDRGIDQYPKLAVVNASDGIAMLCSEDGHEHEHEHEEGEDAHEHGGLNAHVWLDPALAIRQVRNIAEGLAAADGEHAAAYMANAEAYIARLEALDAELRAQLSPMAGSAIVTFHEAFSYFANAYGLVVAGVMANDSGEEPSTRQIARTCDLVKEKDVRALFVEPQYPTKSAETIARETGAKVYTLDPVVSGDGSMESYEQAMRQNARVLTEALKR